MPIPIRNVYYLLCYAWKQLGAREFIDVDDIAANRIENLLGKVLEKGVANLIRRGLDRGYVVFDEEGRTLRGKLLVSDTLKRSLLPSGRVACQVDELSYDVPHNRVIKAAMRALLDIPDLDKGIRAALRDHCRRLSSVRDVALSSATFRNVQLHRNTASYGFLIQVAQLIARSFIPDPRTGRRRFHPFTASEQEMGHLFESFVRNFLQLEQGYFGVSKPKVAWIVERESSSDLGWLPEMVTDIVLTHAASRIVIEAKFYAAPYQSRFHRKKLISKHLYQLLTYVTHLRATAGPEPTGVLLYAGAGEEERLEYRLGGNQILIRRLDLDLPWEEIHRQLLGLATELKPRLARFAEHEAAQL